MTSPDSPKLSSALVCAAYHLRNEMRSLAELVAQDHKEGPVAFPHDVLAAWTGEDLPACWAAVEAANRQGLIELNPSLRTGLLTEKGEDLLDQSGLKPVGLCMPIIRRQSAEIEATPPTAVTVVRPTSAHP